MMIISPAIIDIVLLLHKFDSIIFVSAICSQFFKLELLGILTVLSEELTYAASIIAVELVIVGKTEELSQISL